MRAKDLFIIGCTALTTAFVAGAILSPVRTVIASGPAANLLRVERPVLDAEGMKLSLTTGKESYAAGERAALVLAATNTTARARDAQVKVHMMAVSPASRMSRMVSMPVELWSESLLVALAPGETRLVPIPAGIVLPAGQEIVFTLEVGGRRIQAASFSVPAGPGKAKPPSNLGKLPPPLERAA